MEEGIGIKVEAKNWEDAIRKGGQLLMRTGSIEEQYIDAMVDTVREMGSYIVMAKGVAMPHARPEKGAVKLGMSIMTLQDPIEFGNEENDPVHLVISFSTVDDKGHLEFLSQLAEVLDDETTIDKLVQASSKGEIIDIINGL